MPETEQSDSKLVEISSHRCKKGLVLSVFLHPRVAKFFSSEETFYSSDWCDETKSKQKFYKKNYSSKLRSIINDYYDHVGDKFIRQVSGAKKEDIVPNIGILRAVTASTGDGAKFLIPPKHSETAVMLAQERTKDIVLKVHDEIAKKITVKCDLDRGELV